MQRRPLDGQDVPLSPDDHKERLRVAVGVHDLHRLLDAVGGWGVQASGVWGLEFGVLGVGMMGAG